MQKREKRIFDIEFFESNLGNDKSFAKELANIFLEDFIKRMAELEGAVENKNFNNINEVSHSLRGLLVNIGADNISKQIKIIEDASKKDDLLTIEKNIEKYNKDCRELIELLSEYIQD